MGLFGDVDAAEIPDNPFFVAEGIYRVTLTEATVVEKKNQGNSPYSSGLSLKYVIDEDDENEPGKSLSLWIDLVDTAGKTKDDLTADERTQMSRLKQRLTWHGIPEEEQNSDELTENLVGIEGFATVKVSTSKDGSTEYSNIVKFELPSYDDE